MGCWHIVSLGTDNVEPTRDSAMVVDLYTGDHTRELPPRHTKRRKLITQRKDLYIHNLNVTTECVIILVQTKCGTILILFMRLPLAGVST